MFALIWEILIGLVVGALAKLFMPGKDPGGILVTIIIGIAGSIGATLSRAAHRLVQTRTVGRLHHVHPRRGVDSLDLPDD